MVHAVSSPLKGCQEGPVRRGSKLVIKRPRSKSSTADFVGSRLLRGKRHFRIVLLGCTGSGKTCIINRLLYEKFIQKHLATIEDLHHGVFEINGVQISLDFLDTSGSFEFPAMRKLSIMTGDGFILVFSMVNQSSFEVVTKIRSEIIEEKADPRTPILVIANKCDLLKEITNENGLHYENQSEKNGEVFLENNSGNGHDRLEITSRKDDCTVQKTNRRKKSLSDLLNGRRWSALSTKAEDGEERWKRIMSEMEKQKNDQTAYSNIEQAIERLSAFFSNSSEQSPFDQPTSRIFIPRYSIATYNVYNKDVESEESVIKNSEKTLVKRHNSAIENDHFNLKAYKKMESLMHLNTRNNTNEEGFWEESTLGEKYITAKYESAEINKNNVFFSPHISSKSNQTVTNGEKVMNVCVEDKNSKWLSHRKSSADNCKRFENGSYLMETEKGKREENGNRKKSSCVDREWVESIVTKEWGHSYVEISAKVDEDISTAIFKGLLSQVDIRLQEMQCISETSSSSRLTRLFLFRSAKQVSEDSKLRFRRNSCKVS